jgi:transposase
MQKTFTVKLKSKEQKLLKKLISRGTEKARKLKRCHILLMANEQKTDAQITESLHVSMNTVFRIRQRYATNGLESALNEQQRSGQPPKFNGKQQAQITAIACSKAPEGRSRWTLRLLADKVVELDIVNSIAHKSVGNILKKTNLSLT